MGLLLLRQKRFLEREQLFHIIIDLRNKRAGFPHELGPEGIAHDEKENFIAMCHIASLSNMRRNYEHSKKLLEEIRNQFPKMAQEKGRLFFFFTAMRSLKQRDFLEI